MLPRECSSFFLQIDVQAFDDLVDGCAALLEHVQDSGRLSNPDDVGVLLDKLHDDLPAFVNGLDKKWPFILVFLNRNLLTLLLNILTPCLE